IAAIAWYPTYLTVPVGTIDFTLRRIVILFIFAKLFLQTDLPDRFKFIWLDRLLIICFVAQFLAGATTAQPLSPMAFLENRAGAAVDMVLPYFAVRMIVRNRQQYLVLLKGILIIAAPLAIVGLYECLTGSNPVGFFRKYFAWGRARGAAPLRAGFYRAKVTFEHPIMYGLFFAMFGPVCAGLFHHIRRNKLVYTIGASLMAVGVFSSISAGPWLAALSAVLFITLYFYRRYWKIVLLLAILMCGMVEIIGSRHFYEEIDQFTFSGQTASHRVRLIEVALFEGGMSGHWLTGYGWAVEPGWISKMYPGSERSTDITNHYLHTLSSFGLVGLMPFLAVIIAAAKKLVDSYKASMYSSDKWLVWCLSAGFFGSAVALLSVSLVGPPTSVHHMMIGFAGMMPAIIARPNSLRG
ncbi:MAG: O-antigen ligase family protein, partial [Planctomycetota bacterium]